MVHGNGGAAMNEGRSPYGCVAVIAGCLAFWVAVCISLGRLLS